MSRRIDLFSGQGSIDSVIDLRYMTVTPYDGSNEFHDHFGGETYYQSLSGISHAGWIPATPTVMKPHSYRADTALGLTERGTNFFGWALYVPYDYCGELTETPPVVGIRNNGGLEIRFSSCVSWFTQEPQSEGKEKDFRFITVCVNGREVWKSIKVKVYGDGDWANWLRVYANISSFDALPTERDCTNEFWTELSMTRVAVDVGNGVNLYRTIRGIAREVYIEPETVEECEAMSPEVIWLATDCYVKGNPADGYRAFGRYNDSDDPRHERAYEITLNSRQAVDVLAGNEETTIYDIRNVCVAGAKEKYEQDAAWRRDEAQNERLLSRFDELVKKHGNMEFTTQDSTDAGNCEAGTKDWVAENFSGRESVTLEELKMHYRDPNVWRVIRRKLSAVER